MIIFKKLSVLQENSKFVFENQNKMKGVYSSNSIQHRDSGLMLATLVLLADQAEIKTLPGEWLFDWKTESKRSPVYKLVLVETPNVVQGLMSIEERDGFVFVSLVENAPFNRGIGKIHRGVAVNLFAFACKLSAEKGFGGFVAFEAKTALVNHYQKILGAQQIGNSNRMFIDELRAQILIQLHFPK